MKSIIKYVDEDSKNSKVTNEKEELPLILTNTDSISFYGNNRNSISNINLKDKILLLELEIKHLKQELNRLSSQTDHIKLNNISLLVLNVKKAAIN